MDPVTAWTPPRGRPGGWGAWRSAGSTHGVVTSRRLAAPFSYALWVNVSSTPSFNYLAGDQDSFKGLRMPSMAPSICDGAGDVTSSVSLVLGTWAHVAATVDGTTAKVYVNGVERASGASGLAAIAAIHICNTSGLNNSVQGYYDDLRVYNRVLTPGQVEMLYLNSLRGYPGLLNRLSFLPWLGDTGGGGGTVIPVLMHSYRRRRVN
jgi:hypothetical protein